MVAAGRMTNNANRIGPHLHPLAKALLEGRFEAAGRPKSRPRLPCAALCATDLSLSPRSPARLSPPPPIELGDFRLHDLRRRFATALGEAGVSETIADAILNHKQTATRGGVLGVYQRSNRGGEQVAAMQHWGRLLAAALEAGAPPRPAKFFLQRRAAGEVARAGGVVGCSEQRLRRAKRPGADLPPGSTWGVLALPAAIAGYRQADEGLSAAERVALDRLARVRRRGKLAFACRNPETQGPMFVGDCLTAFVSSSADMTQVKLSRRRGRNSSRKENHMRWISDMSAFSRRSREPLPRSDEFAESPSTRYAPSFRTANLRDRGDLETTSRRGDAIGARSGANGSLRKP